MSCLVAALFAVTIDGLGVNNALLFEAGLLVDGGMVDVGKLADGAELVDGTELVVVVVINNFSWPAVTI